MCALGYVAFFDGDIADGPGVGAGVVQADVVVAFWEGLFELS